MKKCGMILGMLGVLAMMSPAAQAFLVKVNGTTVFADNFEDGPLDGTITADQPQVGTWTLSTPSNAVWNDDDDPYEGNQCLEQTTSRDSIGTQSLGAVSGDLVTIEFAVKSVTAWPTIGLRDATGGNLSNVVFAGDAPYNWGGAGWSDAGTLFTQAKGYDIWAGGHNIGQWNTALLEHVVGTTNLTVTMNGTDTHTFTNLLPVLLDVVEIPVIGSPQSGFFDAIPEPATLSLLALGGLALIRRKRQ